MECEIIVGTYEELVLGYYFFLENKAGRLESSFTDHSHGGSIRAVAISDRVLVTGSSDEKIQLYNLSKRTNVGVLDHHQGTVTDLQFWASSHLFTCSEDGTLSVLKTGKWECLRTFKGHKGAVNSVSVHPSGKLALTVGRDKSLRTWNLVTGRSAFVTNLKFEADSVHWAPDGTGYLIVQNNLVHLYNVQTATVEKSFQLPSRVHCIAFINSSVFAASGDGGDVHIASTETGQIIHKLPTNTSRVKGLCVRERTPASAAGKSYWLITASSDGFIKVWALDFNSQWSMQLVCEVNTTFRLTCLAVAWPRSDSSSGDADAATAAVANTQPTKKKVTSSAPRAAAAAAAAAVDEEEEMDDDGDDSADEKEEAETSNGNNKAAKKDKRDGRSPPQKKASTGGQHQRADGKQKSAGKGATTTRKAKKKNGSKGTKRK